MRVVVVTPPPALLTVADARQQLKLDEGDDDAFLEAAIAAAQMHVDGPNTWLGRSIGRQTLELRMDSFEQEPDFDWIMLPGRPIHEIVSVKYLDPEGVEIALPTEDYELQGHRLCLKHGKMWPATQRSREAVRVRYTAGYDALPKDLRAALLIMVHDLYRNRGSVTIGTIATATPMSTTVENLLAPYRVWG